MITLYSLFINLLLLIIELLMNNCAVLMVLFLDLQDYSIFCGNRIVLYQEKYKILQLRSHVPYVQA